MKAKVKKLIPGALLPQAQSIYAKVVNAFAKARFSREQYEELTALKCSVSYNKYGGYCVPESSRHRLAAQRILANDVHEPETIEFIASNCSDGDIVHAGAYFGDFLPALSAACAADSTVWAFEPNSENHRCAKITMEINGIANVELANAGLGARQETLRLRTSDAKGIALGGTSRIIPDTDEVGAGAEAVQIVTLDGVIGESRTVSIIQLDVEGYEKEALTGALETIRRCRPTIILEVLPNSDLIQSDWFRSNIMELGYRKSADIHSNVVFISQPEGDSL